MAADTRVQFKLSALFVAITVVALLFGATLFAARAVGMNGTQALVQVFLPWALRLPEFAVWSVGAILLVTHRNLPPDVKRLAIAGLAGLFLVSFVGSLLNMSLIATLMSGSIQGFESYYGQISIALGFIGSLLKAACWWMLIRAVFYLRRKT